MPDGPLFAMNPQFVAYSHFWPPSLGPWLWREYRASVIQRDLERARSAGIMHLDVSLLWTDVEPDPGHLSVPVLNHFEHLLGAAGNMEIRIRPFLLPMTIGRDSWLPEWALLPPGHTGPGLVTPSGRSNRQARSPFNDSSLRMRQAAQVAEIIRVFTQHPAVSGWVLGDRVANPEVGAEQLHSWLADMVEAYTRAGGMQPIWHGLSARDAIRLVLPDLGLEDLGVGLIMADDWRAPWARNPDRTWAPFLAFLGTGLVNVPVNIESIQVAEHASLLEIEDRLEAIRLAGAVSCSAESLFDFSGDLRNSPPFDRSPDSMRQGLLRVDGTPKPWAPIWADMSTRASVQRRQEMLDVEYYRRDPETVAREYYLTVSNV